MSKALLERTFVKASDSLRTVLERLEGNPFHICIVVDEDKKIQGTVTDGDCRRGFLKGLTFENLASDVMNRGFIIVDTSFSLDQIRTLIKTNGVQQIPIVDEKRCVIDIVTAAALEEKAKKSTTAGLILAGGKGTRLRPLTDLLPKPMLPINGKPIIEILIERMVASGVNDIFISINYLGEKIQQYFGNGERWNCQLHYLKEESELGTAGPLTLLNGRVQGTLLVANGDLVTSVDFAAMLALHKENSYDLTIGVCAHGIEVPYGVVDVSETGRVVHIKEKPTQTFMVNAGIYVLEPSLIALVPRGKPYPMTDLIQEVISKDMPIGAFPIFERWIDVGLPNQYFNAQSERSPMPK